MKSPATEQRRPVIGRSSTLAQAAARTLLGLGVSPNAVSIGSVLFSAAAGLCMLFAPSVDNLEAVLLLLLSAVCIGARLACNLLDGIMAVEGGHATPSGSFFNDFPDRISDSVIFVCCGFACGAGALGHSLGWASALVAAMTAYIRIFGAASGLDQDFGGPMAKQHRMLVIATGCLLSGVELMVFGFYKTLFVSLVIVFLGGVMTCIRRGSRLVRSLEGGT